MPLSSTPLRWIPLVIALFISGAACAQTVVEAWTRRYHGPVTGSDYALGVAADAAGNTAAAGRSNGSGTAIDIYTAKYAAGTGAILWERRYASAGNDVPYAVAFDPSGNVVVTGYTGTVPASDFYTAKYAADDGALLWQRTYNGPANGLDRAQALAVDAAGNVIVTGTSVNGGAGDYYTAKYAAADGAIIWERRYNGPTNGADAAESVAVDGAGNVIVTGGSANGSTSDYYTAKYAAADGALIWEKRYNGTGNDVDAGHDVAVDAAGNVIVTGYSNGTFTNQDIYTAKYAATDGALVWERRYNGPPGSNFDEGWAVGVDAAGDVFITGLSEGSGTSSDFYTAKYSGATGAVVWERRYNGTGNSSDRAGSLAIGPQGDVFVTGTSRAASGYDDLYTAKYASADGAVLWEKIYDGPAHYTETMQISTIGTGKIAATPEGGAVITGSSQATELPITYDFVTIQYSPPPTAPNVVTGGTTGLAATGATVHASATPNLAATTVWFEYGLDTSYETSTSAQSVGAGFTAMPVSAALSGLSPQTLYHYRAVAQNSAGTTHGVDRTFTTLPQDSDSDQIPDAWETAHGLNPNDPTDAALDGDGDGQDNLSEYAAGTDPQTAASVFNLEVLPEASPGVLRIRFIAQAGKGYTVQYRGNLTSGAWQVLADVPASGMTQIVEVSDSPGAATQRYYRVVTPPAPAP